MITHYLKIAFRGLFRYKWQNVVCVLGLTIGLTAFILGAYWHYWENHFDDFHPNAQYLYGITTTGIAKSAIGTPQEIDQLHGDDVNWMLENIPEIEKYCATNFIALRFMEDGKNVNVMGLHVDSTFFSMFYADFIYGGYKQAPYNGSCIVLTESAAKKYLGKTDCIDEIFPAGNKKIVGVIRDYPANTDFRFEFLSLSESVYNPRNRTSFYVQINPHARISDIREKIENHQSVAQNTMIPDEQKDWSFNFRTMSEIHLNCHSELENRFHNIRLLSIAGLLGLISSLMNHLVLFIGQQLKRQRRNNTFRSLGASTAYLFTKSLIDLLIPLIFALAVSIFFMNVMFPDFQSYTQWQDYGLYVDYVSKPDFNVMILTALKWSGLVIVLFLFTGMLIIAGMLGKTGKHTPLALRRILIVCQVLIGSFFFFVALSLYKQFHFMQNKDKGLRVENIIQIDAGGWSSFDYQIMKEELLRSPYIEDITFTTDPVLMEIGDHYLSIIAGVMVDEVRYSDIRYFVVEPNFLDFFGMKMKEGEWMSEETDVVMNEAQTQLFGEKNLSGQPIKTYIGEGKISGILNNYNYSSMQYPITGLVFILQGKNTFVSYSYAYIKTSPANRNKALEHVQKYMDTQQLTKVADEQQFLALTDIMDNFNRPERTLSAIFGILSLACILVVSFGIYSLITLTIEQRRKEIAIRKTNGAEFVDILRLFFREYLILVIIGNALALASGYYLMQRWFETYAYHTTLSWWLFAIVLIVTSIIVFLSVVSKISEAARIEPAEALKYE